MYLFFIISTGEMMALELLSMVAPRYPLPCRTHFSRKEMPEMYEELTINIREKLRDAKNLSFTRYMDKQLK